MRFKVVEGPEDDLRKQAAQLDTQTLLSNKHSYIESDVDLFIHITDTQRYVTRKKCS
jgi:hypothetical protein